MSGADHLLNLSLDNGWKVIRHLARHPNGTGGTFSQSYMVEKNGRRGFLKAFDFSEAFEPGADTVTILQLLSNAYNYEKEILTHCSGLRLSNVVLAIDYGQVQVPKLGSMEGRVFYLIFEMAEGDVRVQMDVKKKFPAVWCMRALKDVSLGLWQVHREMIAHQDAKPSNVLAFSDGPFKVADFGRSSRNGFAAPHDHCVVAGDPGYAPPELLYGFTHPEFVARRMGCDLYMLGNLAAFLFSGVNVTAQLVANMDEQHRPHKWGATYKEVLPYLRNSFTTVLRDLRPLVDDAVVEDVITLVKELCYPDIELRGHPKGIGHHSQFSLERYVSRLDLLSRKLEIRQRIGKVA